MYEEYKLDKQNMTVVFEIGDKITECIFPGKISRKGYLHLMLDTKESLSITEFWTTRNKLLSILNLTYLNDFEFTLIGETEILEQFVKDYEDFWSNKQ